LFAPELLLWGAEGLPGAALPSSVLLFLPFCYLLAVPVPTGSGLLHPVLAGWCRGRELHKTTFPFSFPQEQAEEGSSEEKRIQWADSFVLVYSICDRASFNILPLKIQFIKAAKEGQSQEKVPIVIVGNKRDLHHQREVSSEEGRLLALSLDCGFYEVSAAEAYHGALMVFHGLAERIPDHKLALKKGTGIRGIVKTMSAVFARKRTDSL
uniref:small monomeric GTPase n=1 Tax=Strix occidentalis caurina TaxID=311401 RepID=A0A8D0KQY3_STROC